MKVFDFSGYATKFGIKCADGRTIKPSAFKHQDGKKVPLVYQHVHDSTRAVLGHAILQYRPKGMYVYASLNNTPAGQEAKEFVEHGDVDSMSIWANRLQESNGDVMHGNIREVSLVLSGANPEALIQTLTIEHGDEISVVDGEAYIYPGNDTPLSFDDIELRHADSESSGEDEETVQDVIDSMNDKQRNVMYALVGAAVEEGSGGEAAQGDEEGEDFNNEEDEGGNIVKHNAFDEASAPETEQFILTHDQMHTIMKDAERFGKLSESILAHADDYGIKDIDILFPDAKLVNNPPEMIARRMEWVSVVMNGVKKTPFSRIKSTTADITADEARAKGYITGKRKLEEVFPVLKRVTTPTTIYKKQKLDRDDIIDITDFDVVSWMKAEMRVMLDEEIARAILIGDGRTIGTDDKINEDNIRPIYKDDELYAKHITLGAALSPEAIIEAVIRSRKYYKGTGNPTFFTTVDVVTDMLLIKDGMGRRIYNTVNDLMAAMRLSAIVEVEVMEDVSREVDTKTLDLKGIMVNLSDYVVGADKGGEVSMFDDFDIDFNQYKYLIETRMSGALVKVGAAIVFEQEQAAG